MCYTAEEYCILAPSTYAIWVDNSKISKVVVTIGSSKKEMDRECGHNFTELVVCAFKGIMSKNLSAYKSLLRDIRYGDSEMFSIGQKILDEERKKYEL